MDLHGAGGWWLAWRNLQVGHGGSSRGRNGEWGGEVEEVVMAKVVAVVVVVSVVAVMAAMVDGGSRGE